MVHRGKYSEGYNFKDNFCRGIFMVGVPNSDISAPKLVMKGLFYQSFKSLFKGM